MLNSFPNRFLMSYELEPAKTAGRDLPRSSVNELLRDAAGANGGEALPVLSF